MELWSFYGNMELLWNFYGGGRLYQAIASSSNVELKVAVSCLAYEVEESKERTGTHEDKGGPKEINWSSAPACPSPTPTLMIRMTYRRSRQLHQRPTRAFNLREAEGRESTEAEGAASIQVNQQADQGTSSRAPLPTLTFGEKAGSHFSACQIVCRFLLWPNWKLYTG